NRIWLGQALPPARAMKKRHEGNFLFLICSVYEKLTSSGRACALHSTDPGTRSQPTVKMGDKPMIRWKSAAAGLALLVAIGTSAAGAVTVSSKIDTEGTLLGNV